ncbi:hypothetical protein RND81_02G236800 [Saponaria officinalis]|uniref:Ubiquitin-like protease family profile domain-containing protein n=1 Tax=Saponaria officinalis TaxID=3572 RepID=A0AAW1MWV8_SAPOF
MADDGDPQSTTTTTTADAVDNTDSKKHGVKIDFDELLRADNDEPPANIVIVPSANKRRRLPPENTPTTALGNDSSSSVDESLSHKSDGELKDQIARLTKQIPVLSRSLPDKGEKLKLQLERLQAESQRRLQRKPQEVTDGCKNSVPACQKFNGESDGPKRAAQASQIPELSKFGSLFLAKCGNDTKPEREQNTSVKGRNAFQDEISYMTPCDKRAKNAGGKLPLSKKAKYGLFSKEFSPWKSNGSRNVNKYNRLDGNMASRPLSQKKLPDSFTSKNGSKDLDSNNTDADKLKDEQTVVLVDEEEAEVIEKVPEAEKRRSRRNECKIFYPSREDPDSLEIFRSELRCLEPGECLTSTIMNFYLRFLQQMCSTSDTSKQKFYFFNTYFYSKLQEAVARQKEDAFFIKFRRWWKGVNIFEKTYIFLPINEDKHWSLVIICISDEDSGPVILHLDSLGLHCSSSIFKNVKSLLENEWRYLKEDAEAVDIPIPDTMKDNLPEGIDGKTIEAPRQTNDYDCGLFVLYYIERFIEDAPEKMSEEHLSKFGKKWFRAQEASSLRGRIKKILMDKFHKATIEDDSLFQPVCLPTVSKTDKITKRVEMF